MKQGDVVRVINVSSDFYGEIGFAELKPLWGDGWVVQLDGREPMYFEKNEIEEL